MPRVFILRIIGSIAFVGVFLFCLHASYRRLAVRDVFWPQDSLSIAINAECINKLGIDEHGVSYPVVGFETFGDYGPTMYVYCLAVLYKFLPNTVQIGQFFSLVLALAFVMVLSFYLRGFLDRQFAQIFIPALALFAFFSPWIGSAFMTPFEFTLCPLLIMIAIWRTDKLFLDPDSVSCGLWLGIILGLLPYAHWGAKFYFAVSLAVLPLVFCAAKGRRAWRQVFSKGVIATYVTALALALPHIVDFFAGGKGLSRANALAERDLGRIAANYVHFFNLKYLFLGPNIFSLYYSGVGGLLCAALLPLFLAGLYAVARAALRDRDLGSIYLALMLPACFLPAALVQSQYYPGNIIRIVIAIPPVLIVCGRGGQFLYQFMKTRSYRPAAPVFMAVFIACGLPLTIESAYLTGNQPVAYRPVPAGWNNPEPLYGCRDHTPDSVYYRYYRLFEQGDLRYCGCTGVGLQRQEP
jgi:hypothetical protein